ncbi:MAG TPA: NADP-dependent oxidoreductase [Verrucomicrobiae bacterium]|jgi:NADPH:quinone reductase-like Zn-dependent oxidoreductase|nr:NADP-dependent oxidoreductase [Verrucomicrobiae bacterium]
MKAIICEQYGGPEVLQFEDVAIPQVGPHGVLVRVHATSVNPIDWRLRQGMFRAVLPVVFPVIWGADCSGVVEEVGGAVTLFRPGDEVFGFKDGRVAKTYRGTYAQYAVLPEHALARKPAGLSHEEAASVPLAALSAWQVLMDRGKMKSGDRVLVQAGAGGVGIFAIQIAKARGAHVAATASTRNQDFLKELGADVAIDYQKDRLQDKISGYDLVLDGVGESVWGSSLAVLRPGGKLVTLLAPIPRDGAGKLRFLGRAASHIVAWTLRAAIAGKRIMMARAKPAGGELEQISSLIEAGKIRTVIEHVFPFEQIAEAHRLSETGHVRGKIVVKLLP